MTDKADKTIKLVELKNQPFLYKIAESVIKRYGSYGYECEGKKIKVIA